MKLKLFLISLFAGGALFAQQRGLSKRYVFAADTLVQKKPGKWKDLKLGLCMHWGTCSQWGVVESWSIWPEAEGWTQRKGLYSADYYGYKTAFENLQTTFNPANFHPEKWVKAAKEAAMKYDVFTTKYHDGFCMFNTKQTDYKITGVKTPFSLSATGFYEVNPASGTYIFRCPVINEATIRLPKGRKFHILIKNNNAAHKYIGRIALNDKNHKHNFLRHSDLMAGGVLEITMTRKPGEFSTASADKPRSIN